MSSAWSRWVDWLTAPEPAVPLALFRFAVGWGVWAAVIPAITAGIRYDLWTDSAHGGMSRLEPGWLLWLLGGATPGNVDLLLGVLLLGGLGLIVGVGGRITAFVTLQAALALLDVNPHAGGSYDELLFNALWLLVLAGGTQTLSIEARWRTGRWDPSATIGRWARFLVVFQLVLMYATTGWQKLSAHWVPGQGSTALYYILRQPTWQRWDHAWVAQEPWYTGTRASTAITWWWEILAPLWLLAWVWSIGPADAPYKAWARRLRVRELYALTGVVFHLLVLGTLEVGPFSWISLCFYACVVHPEEWEQALYPERAPR